MEERRGRMENSHNVQIVKLDEARWEGMGGGEIGVSPGQAQGRGEKEEEWQEGRRDGWVN